MRKFTGRHEFRRRVVRIRSLVALTLFGLASVAGAGNYYEAAPQPEELADILFKPRYRGIVIKDNQTTTQQSSRMFAMAIHFAFDSTNILPKSRPLLDAVGKMMQLPGVSTQRIVVEGHTDAIGGVAYNQRLSERRARAIKRYLTSRFGINPARLAIVGKGESEPHNRRQPTDAANRRVQFRPAG